MTSSLVGSEMCIRDSLARLWLRPLACLWLPSSAPPAVPSAALGKRTVSYTHLTLPTICSV
eukprot:4539849-Prorocentrum_lima.AAC.1